MHSSLQSLRPGRRRSAEPLPSVMSLLVVVFATVSCVSAYGTLVVPRVEDSAHFRELAERGEIHIDTRPQPMGWLDRRQDTLDQSLGELSSSSSTSTSTSASAESSSVSVSESSSTTESETPTPTSSDSQASVTVITTPLPVPFDTSLGSNFTAPSCPSFFTSFLSNATFRSCSPISLLLQSSSSFFRAMRSPSLLSATLDTACAAPLSICQPVMTHLASEILSDSTCGQDFRNQQPLVLQAYNALVAYEPVYRTTCLKTETAENTEYCFSNAVSGQNPSDLYPFLTAVGLNMPAGSKPSCTPCLKQSMQVFAEYAVRKEQPLAQTYLSCASMIEGACGVGYADTTVMVGSVDTGLENGNQGGNTSRGARVVGHAFAVVVAGLAVVVVTLL